MAEDEIPFLSRWSRRKLDAKQAEAPLAPAAVPQAPPADESTRADSTKFDAPPVAPVPPAVAQPLPPIDSLKGVTSEYGAFLKPGVDESLKRAALKKLFNDPHFGFANMDKLDTYIDDYSIEDPIPEAMLRRLNQSRTLSLFEEKEKPDEQEQAAGEGTVTAAEGVESQEMDALPAGANANAAVPAEPASGDAAAAATPPDELPPAKPV